MKKTSRFLALFLTLALLCPLLAIGASAESANVKQYGDEGGYLAFGDSVAHGIGTDGYTEKYLHALNVPDSYPYQIAQAVGCDPDDNTDFWPCCFPGETLASIMDLMDVDDGYTDEEYVHSAWGRYTFNLVNNFGDATYTFRGNGKEGAAGSIRDIIQRADLITVQLGMGEIMYRPLALAEKSGLLSDVTSLAAVPGELAELTALVLGELKEGFDHWVRTFPLFLDTLTEWNDHADILLVGFFNPVADVELWDDALLPIGSAFNGLSDTMNAYYAGWAKEYNCTYVDISNTVTAATEQDMSLFGGLLKDMKGVAGHPTQDGHDYIARQILAALPTADPSEPAAVTTNITVDLAHFTKVDSVLLDGIPVCGCSVEDTILTVPCRHKLAKTLTVNVKNDEKGGTDFVTYLLDWESGRGYTAHRLYEKVAAFPLTTKLAETVHESVKTVAAIVGKAAKGIFLFAK